MLREEWVETALGFLMIVFMALGVLGGFIGLYVLLGGSLVCQ